MKEYKVEVPQLGWRNRKQSFEDLINQYAREGWKVIHIAENYTSMVSERDKNR